MPRVTCSFCGLPFTVRATHASVEHFCCSGCALASRIPMSGGQMPVSAGLVIALVLGFGLFNEVLFAVLGAAVSGEGRPEVGDRLSVVSIAIGAVLLLAIGVLLARARPRRLSDLAAVVPAGVAMAWGLYVASRFGHTSAAWYPLAGSAWLALWLSRGWLRRSFSRTKASGPTPTGKNP